MAEFVDIQWTHFHLYHSEYRPDNLLSIAPKTQIIKCICHTSICWSTAIPFTLCVIIEIAENSEKKIFGIWNYKRNALH